MTSEKSTAYDSDVEKIVIVRISKVMTEGKFCARLQTAAHLRYECQVS